MEQDKLLALLSAAVVKFNRDDVIRLCETALNQGIPADVALNQGLAKGMRMVGEKFARQEYFVPEVLMAAKTMYAGFDILKPHLTPKEKKHHKLALGVVQGDIHDIGKNIVKVMAEASGYEVVDLGRNVPVEQFVNAVRDGITVIGMSALMTTTMPVMGKVIIALKQAGLREKVRVLIGGAPVNDLFAQQIGADGYAPDAYQAIAKLKELFD